MYSSASSFSYFPKVALDHASGVPPTSFRIFADYVRTFNSGPMQQLRWNFFDKK